MKARTLLAAILLSFLLAHSSYTIPPSKELSAEETALAEKLGLDLRPRAEGLRTRSIGEQTWICPWVVVGIVTDLDEDPYGAYHTSVLFRIERYLKGSGVTDISLKLRSGPTYSEHYKEIVRKSVVGAVEFSSDDIGARFVIFLDKNVPSAPGRDIEFRKYALGKKEFRPANRYRLKEGHAFPDPEIERQGANPGNKAYSEDELMNEILRVALPQATLSAR